MSNSEPRISERHEEAAPRLSIEDAIRTGETLKAVPQFEEFSISGEDGLTKRVIRYRYRALDAPGDIRIFRIYPSENSNILEYSQLPSALTGHIIHMKVNSQATYKALSYCWGSLEYSNCVPLQIDGAFGLNVSRSLYEALRAIVKAHRSEVYVDIWADQIAINQHNLKERAQQVVLMDSIFQHASEVVVWLDPSDPYSVCLFQFADRLTDWDWEDLMPQILRSKSPKTVDDVLNRLNIPQTDTELAKVSLEATLRRPWFWRLWTFQEAVLATRCTLWCGTNQCSLFDMCRTSRLLTLYRGFDGASNLDKIIRHRINQQTGGSYLDDLLLDLNGRKYRCSEQHDRVYALLALQRRAGLHGHCKISVDYENPVSTVMEEVTRAAMSNTHRLRMLNHDSRPGNPQVPSWIPNWDESGLAWRLNVTSFAASGELSFQNEQYTAGILRTEGRIAATIMATASHDFSAPEDAYAICFPEGRPGSCVDRWMFFTPSLLRTIISRTLSSLAKPDALSGRIRSPEEATMILLTTFFCEHFPKASMDCAAQGTEDAIDTCSRVIRQLISDGRSLGYCYGRKFAFLDKWETPMALIPNLSEIDDMVCILNGSELPLVLRKKGQRYQLIGPCFVQGMMHGEMVDWAQGEGDVFELE